MKKLIGGTGFLAVLAVLTIAATALATTGAGISTSILSLGRFGKIDVNIDNSEGHQVKVKTKGDSDVYVVYNKIAPRGTTGWHTHPGPSLITVKSGTVTNYSSDDPTCTPQVYTAGMGFIDPGGDDAHILRNEGSVDAETMAVQILPAGAGRRNDVPNPGNCAF